MLSTQPETAVTGYPGLRPLYAKGCRMHWLQLYNMNHVTLDERTQFLLKLKRRLPLLAK